MQEKFVEYHNPKDGKTYLVTEKEDREIRLFSVRFLFVLSFAMILYLTRYVDLIYVLLLSILILIVLEVLNFRFRVKLFSVRFPVESKEKIVKISNYTKIRGIIYSIIGLVIIAYTFYQYRFVFEVYSVFMYAIGASFIFQSFRFLKK